MIFRVLSLLPLVLLPPRYAGKGFKFVRFTLALTLGVRGHLGSIFLLRTILSRAFSRPRGGANSDAWPSVQALRKDAGRAPNSLARRARWHKAQGEH